MNKEDVQAILDQIPVGTEFFIRIGHDDCYPAEIRLFDEECAQGEDPGIVAYVQVDKSRLNEHRNLPDDGEIARR